MKRQSPVTLLVLFAFWLMLVLACGGFRRNNNSFSKPVTNSDAPSSSTSNTSRSTPRTEEITKARYEGEAVTTITYRDGLGNTLGTKTFKSNVLVIIAPPVREGAVVDSNPITLGIAPASSSMSEGQIDILSAFPHMDSRDGVSFMVQDWELSLDGTQISGILKKVTYGAVHNFLQSYKEIAPGSPELTMMWNYPIRSGTKLSGTLEADAANFEISGNVDEGTRLFTVKVSATRIDD